MIQTQIILTFSGNKGQKILEISYKKDVSEEEFISDIFKNLSRNELENLVKISVCLMCLEQEAFPFILENNGKYYFNIDVNDDDETIKWYNYKTKYILLNHDLNKMG
jgi:hypothetical protein